MYLISRKQDIRSHLPRFCNLTPSATDTIQSLPLDALKMSETRSGITHYSGRNCEQILIAIPTR